MARLGRGQPFAPKLAKPLIAGNGTSSWSPVHTVSPSAASGTITFYLRAGYGYAACWAQTTIIDLSTPTVTDNLGNTWTFRVLGSPSAARSGIATMICEYPGTATITCSVDVNTTWKWQILEIPPARLSLGIRDTVAWDNRPSVGVSQTSNSSTTFHDCATPGLIYTNPMCTVVACGGFTGTTGGQKVPETGYTMWSEGHVDFYSATKYSDSALTAEVPEFETANVCDSHGCCVSFYSYGGDGALAFAGLYQPFASVNPSRLASPRVIAY